MDQSITRTATQHFGKGDRADRDSGASAAGDFQIGPYPCITYRELGQTFAVEDQRAASGYPASGHAASASATNSSGMAP